MNRRLQTEIAFLNLKGRLLRSLILGFKDDELKIFFPSPSPEKINELLNRSNKLFISAAQKN